MFSFVHLGSDKLSLADMPGIKHYWTAVLHNEQKGPSKSHDTDNSIRH